MRFKLEYFYNIKESIKDDIKHDIKKRLLNSIIRNDICFLKENSPYLIENAEELVEKSVDMNLDNDTIMWIINKYKHIMDIDESSFGNVIDNLLEKEGDDLIFYEMKFGYKKEMFDEIYFYNLKKPRKCEAFFIFQNIY